MSNNAYAYAHRVTVEPKYPGHELKHEDKPMTCQATRHAPQGRGDLSFTAHTLFQAIGDITAWSGTSAPCSNDAMVQTLATMAAELEHFGMYSYWRLKAWMDYHSDAVCKVGKMNKHVVKDGTGAGAVWLAAEECPFRLLARCYFEIADEQRALERKERRRGVMM